MKTIIKILTILMVSTSIAHAGAYRDEYEIGIQRQLDEMDAIFENGGLSVYQKKQKQYLENRLQRIQAGIGKITFSSEIKNGDPVDSITSISYQNESVYFFSEILGMKGEYVTHIWYFQNNLFFKQRMKIKKSIWKFWTSISIDEDMVGKWKGTIVDDNDNILITKYFEITN